VAMTKAKISLKTALSSSISRLKHNQKTAQRVQQAHEKANKRPHGKGKAKQRQTIATNPFSPTDKILLVGEGNFSFARSLLLSPLPPHNITATAYDSEDECYTKYPDAHEIVRGLRETGVCVLFGIDATRLEKCAGLKRRRWDRVVWNFPHAGEAPLETAAHLRPS
jgi:25S rRNA (uracil2634-N3)-methyltransferase